MAVGFNSYLTTMILIPTSRVGLKDKPYNLLGYYV
nr:MAG TPA_asm: hypothetical protein [Caudoviricetes sp.]